MEASREEAILLLRKWQSDRSEIRCNVIRQPEFVISLSVTIASADQSSLVLRGADDSRVLIDISSAEFEFLDARDVAAPAVLGSLLDAVLGILFRPFDLSFILAVRSK